MLQKILSVLPLNAFSHTRQVLDFGGVDIRAILSDFVI